MMKMEYDKVCSYICKHGTNNTLPKRNVTKNTYLSSYQHQDGISTPYSCVSPSSRVIGRRAQNRAKSEPTTRQDRRSLNSTGSNSSCSTSDGGGGYYVSVDIPHGYSHHSDVNIERQSGDSGFLENETETNGNSWKELEDPDEWDSDSERGSKFEFAYVPCIDRTVLNIGDKRTSLVTRALQYVSISKDHTDSSSKCKQSQSSLSSSRASKASSACHCNCKRTRPKKKKVPTATLR